MDDLKWMYEALKEAEKSFVSGEVPVGAVLVHEGSIIGRAHNLVEMRQDASAHAEMLCLKQGVEYFQNWRLYKTTLYCTLEPCAMCLGALFLHRVERLVWGAPDLRHGANGSWVDLLAQKHPTHALSVTAGVLANESTALMKKFFTLQRSR